MGHLTMTDSFTRFFRNLLPEPRFWGLVFWWAATGGLAWAQTTGEIQQLRVERIDEEVVLSAQLQFDLPATLEEVLAKGIPLIFTAEAEIYRERWYWFDRRVSIVQRSYRLAYQPLSRRWRVLVLGPQGDGAGLSMNQSYESLSEAMNAIKRIARWRIADATQLDAAVQHRVEFRYRLDVNQLALPMQIGTLGQSDWNVTLSATTPLALGMAR